MGSFFEDFHKIFPAIDNIKRVVKRNVGDLVNDTENALSKTLHATIDTVKELPDDPMNFVGSGAKLVGAMSPKVFLQKNPEFANTIFKDAEGNIKELYHGTSKDKDFKKFSLNQRGNFIGQDPKMASQYAIENDSMGYHNDWGKLTPKNTASQVKPLYVNVQSPYYLEGEELAKYVKASSYAKAQREIMFKAKSLGHDAVIYPDGGIAIADPKQIKSSITGD